MAAVAAMTVAAVAAPAAAQGSLPPLPDHRTFSGEATAQGAVSLDWGHVRGADSYDVRFWDRDLYEYTVLAAGANSNGITLTFDGSSATVSGLPDHYSVYWFGVRARNTHGTSAWPAIGIVVTPYQPSEEQAEQAEEEEEESVLPPARPAKPTVASASHNSVTIEWGDPGDDSITGYQILRRDRAIHGNGVFVVILDDTGTADTAHTDSTVAASSRYVYRVKAINSGGSSPRSSYADAETPAAPQLVAPVLKSGQQNLDPNLKNFDPNLQNFDPIDPEVILDQEPSLGTFYGHPIQAVIEPDSGRHRFTLGDNVWTQYDLDRGDLNTPDRVGTTKGRGDEDWFRVALQDNRVYFIEIIPVTTGLTQETIDEHRFPRIASAHGPNGQLTTTGTGQKCYRHAGEDYCDGFGHINLSTWPESRGSGNYHIQVAAVHNMQEQQQDYEIRVSIE